MDISPYKAQDYNWQVEDKIASLSFKRPDRKNPHTFESYAEMRDLFHELVNCDTINVVVIRANGDNFCSGGYAYDMIGATKMLHMLYLTI